MKNGALSICPGQEISYTEGLEIEVETLRARLGKAEEQCAQINARYEREAEEWKQEKTALLATISILYAPRSEKQRYLGSNCKQLQFDLPGLEGSRHKEEEEEHPALVSEAPAPPRRQKHKKKTLSEILDLLPVEEEIIEDVSAPSCAECGEEMKAIGYVTWKELCVHPAQLYARMHKSPVFACRNCEKTGTMVPIVRPDMPLARPLEHCLASAETLAWLVYQKLAMFTPLYRLEAFFYQTDIEISRATLCNWMLGVCEAWLESLAARMHAELLTQAVIHADETSYQVLGEPGRKAQSKGYCWIFCSSSCGTQIRYMLFIYRASRAHEVPMEFLKGFRGYLMTDAYGAYDTMAAKSEWIFLCRCWAHCRRQWYNAMQAVHPAPDSALATGYAYIQKFFSLENTFKELSLEERFFMRLKYEKTLLDEFHAWLEQQYQGKTAFGKAVKYTLDHWNDLYQVLADGRLPATNASAELMAKSVALSRKNSLFSASMRGADAVMAGFSVIETAKANRLKPYEYLLWIFSEMPKDWKIILESGLKKALEQTDRLANRTLEEFAPLIRQSIKISDAFVQTHNEWTAFAQEVVREKIVAPVLAEVQDALVSEAKFVLAQYYLPQHAPPTCRKAARRADTEPEDSKNTA